ncbi:hypothetical protein I3760_12G036500 [Carya illinoinensis]|nr:hypothetical protein I3760_12G036500 [Carya illinoinensis]
MLSPLVPLDYDQYSGIRGEGGAMLGEAGNLPDLSGVYQSLLAWWSLVFQNHNLLTIFHLPYFAVSSTNRKIELESRK